MLYTSRKEYLKKRVLNDYHYGLYTAVDYVVCKIDPAGFVKIGEPNEYGIEIYEILDNMKNCYSAADCRQLFYEVFTFWFCVSFGKEFLEAPDELFEEFFEFYLKELDSIQ